MSKVGARTNPLQVAIIGSGPAGFYTARALLNAKCQVRVDMFDRLPTPFGLVRSGVAPDHPKLKEAIKVYDKVARGSRFTFLGNVTVGSDVGVEELQAFYHAIVFACGAEGDRRLGIPGEDLHGSHSALEFVGWYNGHPDYCGRQFDLSCDTAVVVGQGNVAADVCRILARPASDLNSTDIAAGALETLRESRIRDVYVVGRRGAVQARFSPPELKELGELDGCLVTAEPTELSLNPASEAELADPDHRSIGKNYALFQKFSANQPKPGERCIHFRFLRSPVRLLGGGRVEGVELAINRLEGKSFCQRVRPAGPTEVLPCGLVIRCIGYRGLPVPGVPFDDKRAVIPTEGGRVCSGNAIVRGMYAAGWIHRGPTGLIGNSRADGIDTAAAIVADRPLLDDGCDRRGAEALLPRLAARGVRVVSYADWRRIDAAEIRRGRLRGKPREKFTCVGDMLEACATSARGAGAEAPGEGERQVT